jgi:hypothetical protein
MNLRSLLLRAAFVVALLGFAFVAAALTPRAEPNANSTDGRTASPTLLPLIALPLVHALLSP